MKDDGFTHQPHYNHGAIEAIDYIEDQGDEFAKGFNLGNAIKYITRAGKKDPTKTSEDLGKAVWYINREIKRLGEYNGSN
jgi:hypothetical protein